MKKILKFIKTFLLGIFPALSGSLVALDVYFAIRNIQLINVSSGWPVVYYFALAATEIFLGACLIYELGDMYINSRNWTRYIKHIEAETADTIDSSASDNETSGEATDTSSETKSKGKRKKS
jgi:hypothetical protein